MKRVVRLPFVVAIANAMLAPSIASAHVRLIYPPPRYAPMGNDDMNIKTGPCGRANDSRTTDTSRITVLEPGATIMVQFSETIGHSGFYRISFDEDGQDAFVAPTMRSQIQTMPPFTPPVLLDNIPDVGAMGANMYTAMVTLPNVQCERCTLQVIQVMIAANTMTWAADGPDPDIYFTCADIALRGGAGGMGGTGGAGGGTGGVAGGAGGTGGVDQGGVGGAGGSFSGSGGVPTGGALPTGGVGGAGLPTGGTGGATATGGTPPAGGTPGAGSPGAGAPGAGARMAEPLEEPGCGCRTVPTRSGGLGFAAAALALVFAVRRRRESRSDAA